MLGKKISFYRSVRNYRIEDLAAVLGVTRQAVMKWEAGKSVPDVLTMKKIADYLSVPLEKFLEETEEKTGDVEMKKMVSKEQNIELGPVEKYYFGKVTVGANGQIKIPEEAMKKFGVKTGDRMLLLGDLERGFEIIYEDILWSGYRKRIESDKYFNMHDEDKERN